jgi:hypothetical protein
VGLGVFSGSDEGFAFAVLSSDFEPVFFFPDFDFADDVFDDLAGVG